MRGNGTTVLSSRREWPLRSTDLDAGLYHWRKGAMASFIFKERNA